MSDAARITSLGVGVCTCHKSPISMSGIIVTGSGNTKIGNLSSARITDIVLGFCGHPGVLVTGSPTIQVNNLTKCKVSSSFVGCFTGMIVVGFPGVILG